MPFRERADIYIVHSCAVTAKAGFQTRQLLRRARRANPDALIVAAGCYAQLEADRIADERLATHILGNPGKFNLLEWLNRPGSFERPCLALDRAPRSCSEFEILPVSRMHTGRTRAMLKIQDGCDSFCSYCVVPHVRGRSRSLPAQPGPGPDGAVDRRGIPGNRAYGHPSGTVGQRPRAGTQLVAFTRKDETRAAIRRAFV